jgi:DNA-binding transcriptional ArsR family regulator
MSATKPPRDDGRPQPRRGPARSPGAVASGRQPAAEPRCEPDPRGAAFDRAFDRAFGLVAFAMNRHLIDHMLRAQRELQVDFESIVIWGLLAHLNSAHLVPPGSSPRSILDDTGRLKDLGPGLRPLRLRDLEQISRMPRETVRRKLAALEAKGYVERSGQGWVYRRDSVDARLIEFNRETARRLLLAAEEIGRLLADGHAQATAGDAAPR